MNSFIEKKIKNKNFHEIFMYGIFGVGTTIVNILIYQVFLWFQVDYKLSNLIALIGAKLFAYVVNKNFVFKSKCSNFKELFKEFIRFTLARGVTGLIDYFGLIFAVEILNLSEVYSKYVLQFIVIVLNYVLGKKAVFIKK